MALRLKQVYIQKTILQRGKTLTFNEGQKQKNSSFLTEAESLCLEIFQHSLDRMTFVQNIKVNAGDTLH
jgi:hypothetical protein